MTRIGLIAGPDQGEAIETLALSLQPVGLYNPTRSHLENAVPLAASLPDLLQRDIEVCCILTPYPLLGGDVLACLDKGVHVVSAGPLALTSKEVAVPRPGRLLCDDPHRHAPLDRNLIEQSRRPDFGEPVYLRQVLGGGANLWTAWWAAWRGLQRARRLLDAPLQSLHLAAYRSKGRFHLALTARMANRANAQVAVVPYGPPLHPDVHLLGTGGQISGHSPGNGPAFIGPAGLSFLAPRGMHPEAAWLAAILAQMDAPLKASAEAPDMGRRLLRAIRSALRQERPVRVSLPRGLA